MSSKQFVKFEEFKEFKIGPAPDLKLLEKMCKMFKRCKRLPLPSQGKGGAKLKLFKIFDHFQQAKNAGIK